MTMDFDPPRVERPHRGAGLMLAAAPIGVLGYFVASWSPILDVVFMIFLGLVQVLLYRRGARARVIGTGRRPLLVTGSAITLLAVIGGTALTSCRLSASTGTLDAVTLTGLLSLRSGDALLGAILGVAAGIFSLIYFTRRFSRVQHIG